MKTAMGLGAAFFLGIFATVLYQWSTPSAPPTVPLPTNPLRHPSRCAVSTRGSSPSSAWWAKNWMRRFYEGPGRG